jgi:hypothetical protein
MTSGGEQEKIDRKNYYFFGKFIDINMAVCQGFFTEG